MNETTLDGRVAQLETIVATQSEMILKLVEMMNHLGQESAAMNERLEKANALTAEQFARLGDLFQRLVGQLDGNPPPGAN